MGFKQYGEFVDSVQNTAKRYHENIHLLLSSVAVKTDENRLLNMSLYVQCGQNPEIHSFSKSSPNNTDISYSLPQSRFQNLCGKNHVEFFSSDNGTTVSNDSVFIVRTAGGAEYLQAIDVCSDFSDGCSKRLLLSKISRDVEVDNYLFPQQVDQIVTSNYISLTGVMNDSIITDNSLTHVDAEYSIRYKSFIKWTQAESVNTSTLSEDSAPFLEKFIHGDKFGFKMLNCPFGVSPAILPTEERSLGHYSSRGWSDLPNRVSKRNSLYGDNFISSHLFFQKTKSVTAPKRKRGSAKNSLTKRISKKRKIHGL